MKKSKANLSNKASNKMPYMRGKNTTAGITLIALVVTIVVLLILAAVSINLVLGENGLISKAKDSRDATKYSTIKDEYELYKLNKEMYEQLGLSPEESLTQFFDRLESQGTITAEDRAQIDAENKLTIGNYEISFAKTLVEAFIDGDIEVGSYVNYKNPTTVSIVGEGYTSTGYTSSAAKTGMTTENGYSADINQTYSLNNAGTQVNWRVLGLSEDGQHLLLTTGSPLKREYNTSAEITYNGDYNNPYYYLYGAEGYINSVDELDKICAIYKNDLAEEARSITVEDINRLCEVTVDVAGKQVTNSSGTNIDSWGNIGLTYTYPTSTYPTQYKTPEDYLAGNAVTYSAEDTSNRFSKTSDAYNYSGSDAISDTSPLYDILFARTVETNRYWLASRVVRVRSDFCDFGVGFAGNYYRIDDVFMNSDLFRSIGNEGDVRGAVRPVVSLKSGVTVDEIQKIATPTTGEEAWDF